MTKPTTLLEIVGADPSPGRFADCALLLIDCQNEYRSGKLPLAGISAALDQVARLLDRGRAAGTPIFHVVHRGSPGGLFDLHGEGGRVIDAARPRDGEATVEKTLPNAFAGTDLAAMIEATGRRGLIICGFQTHMCVSSTVRAALDLGYRSTVVAAAAATRDLPAVGGGVPITARHIHEASLAALADRFAVVVASADDIAD